jgi:hypothetical protein
LADAIRMEGGNFEWHREDLPRERAGEDEAFWRGLEQKLRRVLRLKIAGASRRDSTGRWTFDPP